MAEPGPTPTLIGLVGAAGRAPANMADVVAFRAGGGRKTEKQAFIEGWVEKGKLVRGMVKAFTACW